MGLLLFGFTPQRWYKRNAIILFGHRLPNQFTDCRQHILKTADMGCGFTRGNHSRPSGKHRCTDASFMHIALVSAQASGGVPKTWVMTSLLVCTIITGEHHKRIPIYLQLFQ